MSGNVHTNGDVHVNNIRPNSGGNVHIDTIKPVTQFGDVKLNGNVVIDQAEFTASGTATNAITAIISHGNQGGSNSADSIVLTTALADGTLVVVSGITNSGATQVNNGTYYIKQEGSLGFGALGVGLYTDVLYQNPVRLMTTGGFIQPPSGTPIATYQAGSFTSNQNANLEIKGHTTANTLTATGNVVTQGTGSNSITLEGSTGGEPTIHIAGASAKLSLKRGTADPLYFKTSGIAKTIESNIDNFLIGKDSTTDAVRGLAITQTAGIAQLVHDGPNDVWKINTSAAPSTFETIATTTPADLTLKAFQETVVALGNQSGDISSALNVDNGTIYSVTATGDITINSLGNAVAGTSFTLIITQDGTGSRLLTAGSNIKWAGGQKTLSTAGGGIDVISVFFDGTTYFASLGRGFV